MSVGMTTVYSITGAKMYWKYSVRGWPTCQVTYQTRETAFDRDIQIPKRELKMRRAAEYF